MSAAFHISMEIMQGTVERGFHRGIGMQMNSIPLLLLQALMLVLVGCGGDTASPLPTYTTYPIFTPVIPAAISYPTQTPYPIYTATALPSTPTSKSVPTPLQDIRVELVFPNLDFQRLTNLAQPDDGQSHIFVSEQPGQIHVFPDDPQTTKTKVFLDIRDRVSESSNEEGLLGLAFDTKYSTNGHFYVYYSASSPRRSVISRFSVNQSDPNTADPSSETIILEIPQPYSNHNGGQIAFGPDGYLYIGLGD
ncbi:PQQ-dependent sugar dehydrogenase, partial [SAR202 cluster bacterium AC-647-N09_OGT_505m]|nr:PQQ-dependent sugar dehydrogenase [SAR202 cluster bacterium AC-647-N09_OGT_505m]